MLGPVSRGIAPSAPQQGAPVALLDRDSVAQVEFGVGDGARWMSRLIRRAGCE
jgi:hypothetical protein